MNALSRLRTTVTSITEPADTHVGWIDVSNADSPVLKIYSNGEWKPLSSSGGGSDSLEFIVMENSEWLKASSGGSTYFTKAEACAAAGITEELWDSLLSGESTPDLLFTVSGEHEGQTMTQKARGLFISHAAISSPTQRGTFVTWKLFQDPRNTVTISLECTQEYVESEMERDGAWGPYLYTVTGVDFAAGSGSGSEQEHPVL